jgi:hypothetical protein
LAQQAETLPLARVLQAVELPRARPQAQVGTDPLARLDRPEVRAGREVPPALDGSAAAWREPAQTAATGLGDGPAPCPDLASLETIGARQNNLGASAGHRVEEQLRRRLERLVQLELQRLTLAELLYDQRSWEASLGPEGGVMLS